MTMRIFFNREPITGPWGGGSKILSSIVDACVKAGHTPVFDSISSCDVIFCMDPRSSGGKGGYSDLLQAKKPIVQRVGDIGTHGKPELIELLKRSIPHSKRVIFPSRWACDEMGLGGEVIQNAPLDIFYRHRRKKGKIEDSPVKVVTHHWSMNFRKGFGFYREFISATKDCGIEFNFIGRSDGTIPSQGAMDEEHLSVELPKYDIYLTASEAEAGANHVLEAKAAGLPIVYRRGGGSISEYCNSAGICVDTVANAVDAITKISSNYAFFEDAVHEYSDKIENMALKYVKIIEETA